ncbi:gliding motility-associated C-terminal domain-containing protein [Flavobacterium sp. J372]|uniref:gliding motility-associated C-terminal domain-containing protein n=1 Tax=Flavobacterium sp. J372 TaxID=2898436 RepID=UPI00215111F5|nr:gliding motility-associated C-terminal domain-containing protein [Flavobacterium sp. J372]MCR5863285.1 gliding motility-associated C-terminal domain-containing protein [Flavobacterium sp. J372]
MKKILSLIFVFSATYMFAASFRENRMSSAHDSSKLFVEVFKSQIKTTCDQFISLTLPESNNFIIYRAANSVRVGSGYRIEANSNLNITMKAGRVIVLEPKTALLKGNKYLGRIEPCEPTCPLASDCKVPKGLSPNGDNKNDTFDLSEICVRKLKIFNRYGLTVYEADNYMNEWHGQSSYGDLPTATYFYVITLTSGEKITGWVYLQK